MPDYTTRGLIENVKTRGSIPTTQPLFKNENFAALANDELQSLIVPLIMSVREEHFVTSKDYTIVQNQAAYDIPADAIGMKLRDVVYLQDPNRPQNQTSLPRLQPEDIAGAYIDYAQPSGFYIQGNSVVLYPAPQYSGTLRLTYFKRCSELVDNSQAGKITNVDSNTNEVTLSVVPNTWTTSDLVDVVNVNPPFNTVSEDLQIVAVNGFTLTLSSVAGLSVGNWVCLQDETVVPQIPVECHRVLAQATVVKVLEALGDDGGMQRAQAKLNELTSNMTTILNPRVDGEPKKIVSAGRSLADWNRISIRRPW